MVSPGLDKKWMLETVNHKLCFSTGNFIKSVLLWVQISWLVSPAKLFTHLSFRHLVSWYHVFTGNFFFWNLFIFSAINLSHSKVNPSDSERQLFISCDFFVLIFFLWSVNRKNGNSESFHMNQFFLVILTSFLEMTRVAQESMNIISFIFYEVGLCLLQVHPRELLISWQEWWH